MSSIEWAELGGLNIALINLRIVKATNQDEEWFAVTEWMTERIKQLNNKKRA